MPVMCRPWVQIALATEGVFFYERRSEMQGAVRIPLRKA
jgi:hypothetical protein